MEKKTYLNDEAAALFSELVRNNKIPIKYSDLRKTIFVPTIQTKSKVDYHGWGVNKTEAERGIVLAKRFLEAVKNSISTDFARAKSVRSYKILSEFCR